MMRTAEDTEIIDYVGEQYLRLQEAILEGVDGATYAGIANNLRIIQEMEHDAESIKTFTLSSPMQQAAEKFDRTAKNAFDQLFERDLADGKLLRTLAFVDSLNDPSLAKYFLAKLKPIPITHWLVTDSGGSRTEYDVPRDESQLSAMSSDLKAALFTTIAANRRAEAYARYKRQPSLLRAVKCGFVQKRPLRLRAVDDYATFCRPYESMLLGVPLAARIFKAVLHQTSPQEKALATVHE